jgi:RNA polymerase sigma factor (sigma-70 family)
MTELTIEHNDVMHSELSDEALAGRARAGERMAFEVLCDRYLPIVTRRLRMLLPAPAVEDVAQEVFIAVIRSIARYREDALFRTWISGIIRFKVADYYRGEGRQPVTVELEPAYQVCGENSEAWREQTAAFVALRQLKVEYQEVVLLRFAEGLPFKEIAGVLGISLEATKSRYRRAIQALAEEMGVTSCES